MLYQYYSHLEVAPTAASNKTLISGQQNALSCRGNVCIYCGKCRDWIYDNDIDCDNNHVHIFDGRRWHRSLGAKCFFGYHHFGRYYQRHDDDDSMRFYRSLKNHDPIPECFDDIRDFHAHLYNVCECV